MSETETHTKTQTHRYTNVPCQRAGELVLNLRIIGSDFERLTEVVHARAILPSLSVQQAQLLGAQQGDGIVSHT